MSIQELTSEEFVELQSKVAQATKPANEVSKWDLRFMVRAASIAQWSKDPSTQVGCVLVRPDKTVASEGYNGLAPQIKDTEERLTNRELKYAFIDHAEENALDYCRDHYPMVGFTAYVYPIHSCTKCFAKLLKHGITRIVTVGVVHPRVSVKLPHILAVIEEAKAAGIHIDMEFLDPQQVSDAILEHANQMQKVRHTLLKG